MFNHSRRAVRKIFKKVDLFGQPVLLSYKKSTKYKTTFGGILTVILIFCVVIMSIESIKTLLFREKIYTSSSVLSNLNPIEHNINLRDGYYFAVGFNPEIYNNWTTRIFTFLVLQKSYKRHSNGTRYLAKESIVEMEPCSQIHFPADYDYIKYGQGNWICPPRNITLNLKGQFESDEFNYFRISVLKCKNSTQNNYTCMSQEEITQAKAKLVGDDGKIYLKMVISSHLFNMENFNQPIVHYLDSTGFFLIDPNASFKSVDVFVKHNTVRSDYNLIFSDTSEKTIPSLLNYREQVSALTSDVFASIYLRCALERGLHIGTTEKVTIILANFGGLMSTVYALLSIMARFINRKRMLISISNFLYNFEFSGEKKFESPVSEIEIEEVKNSFVNFPSTFRAAEDGESRRKDEGLENPDNQDSIKKEVYETKKHHDEGEVKFLNRVAAYLQRFTKIKMSVLTIINLFLCRRKRKRKNMNEKLQLSRKAFKKVESDMDVMQLIRKVKEIEKLKDFLFDEHQKVIFEFFPREVIKSKPPPKLKKKSRTSLKTFVTDARKKFSTVKKTLHSEFLKKLAEQHSETLTDDPNKIYTELFSAYQYLTQTEGHPRQEDNKLITLLGKEILKIIKIGEKK